MFLDGDLTRSLNRPVRALVVKVETVPRIYHNLGPLQLVRRGIRILKRDGFSEQL